jgi:tetratricopeptide (TPR) repeat protein
MKTAEEWCSEGVARARAGDLAGALAAHEAALALDPSHFGALSRKPLVEHSLGLHEAAIASYRLALQADPLLVEHVVELANLLMVEGDEAGAWNTMAAYFNAGGDDPRMAVNAAYLAESFGRADFAVNLVSGVQQRHPNNAQALAACANVAGLIGDHAAAVNFAKAAAAVDPSCRFTSKWLNLPRVA